MSNCLAILDKLVSIDTASNLSTLEAVNFVVEYLKEHHIKFEVVHKFFNGVRDDKRGTILATIGDSSKPGIILSGHLDTVDINHSNEKWRTNPLRLTSDGHFVYGRGVVDMKGAISVALSLIDHFKKNSNKVPIHFCFTHDEESDLTAIYQLKDNRFNHFFPFQQIGCVVMEATNFIPIISHRGNRRLEIIIHGKESHASVPNKGCNALFYGVKIYNYINKLYENFCWKKDERYDYNHAVLNIGKLCSGDCDNYIPQTCELLVSCRYLYEDNIDKFFYLLNRYINKIKIEMKATSNECDIIVNEKDGVFPLATSIQSDFYKRIYSKTLSFQNLMEDKNNFIRAGQVITYGTEAGHFQSMGISSVVCGPGSYDSMSTSHKPNEKIEIKHLVNYKKFLKTIQLV